MPCNPLSTGMYPSNIIYSNFEVNIFLNNDITNRPLNKFIPISGYNFKDEVFKKIKHLEMSYDYTAGVTPGFN